MVCSPESDGETWLRLPLLQRHGEPRAAEPTAQRIPPPQIPLMLQISVDFFLCHALSKWIDLPRAIYGAPTTHLLSRILTPASQRQPVSRRCCRISHVLLLMLDRTEPEWSSFLEPTRNSLLGIEPFTINN